MPNAPDLDDLEDLLAGYVASEYLQWKKRYGAPVPQRNPALWEELKHEFDEAFAALGANSREIINMALKVVRNQDFPI